MNKRLTIFAFIITLIFNTAVFANESEATDKSAAVNKARKFFSGIGCESLANVEKGDVLTHREFVSYISLALGLRPEYDLAEEIEKKDMSELEKAAKEHNLILREYNPDSVIKKSEAIRVCMQVTNYLQYTTYYHKNTASVFAEAVKLGLYDNVGTDDTELVEDDALIIIYNTLNANCLNYKYVDGDIKIITDDETVLSDYRKIYETEGIMNANPNTSITDSSGNTVEGYVKIDGNQYGTEYDINSLLGFNITAYYRLGDFDEPIIVYAEPGTKNNIAYIDASDIDKLQGNILYYYESKKGTSKKYRLDKSFNLIYNGVTYNDYSNNDFQDLSGTVTLIDNNDDGNYDVVLIEANEYIICDYIDAVDKKVIQIGSKVLDLDDNDVKYNCYRLNRNNEYYNVELADFVVDVPVCMQSSKNGKIINLYEIDYEKGIVTGTGTDSIVIDGKKYDTSDGLCDKYGIAINYTGFFPMDGNGKIVGFFAKNLSSDFSYAYLINAYPIEEDECAIIKLFTSFGEIEKYTITDFIWIDNEKIDAKDIKTRLINSEGDIEQVIRFRKNREGKLSAIDTAQLWAPADANEYGYPKSDDSSNSLIRCVEGEYNYKNDYGVSCFADNNMGFNAGGNSTVFIVNTNTDESDDARFKIGLSYLSNGEKRRVGAYDIDSGGTAGAVVVYMSSISDNVNVSVSSSLITDVRKCVMPNDDIGYEFTYWLNGNYDKAYLENADIKSSGSKICRGDVVRMVLDKDKIVKQINIDYDYEKKGANGTAVSYFNNEMAYLSYSTVSLYSYKNNYLLVSNTEDGDGGYDYGFKNLKNYCMNNAKIIIFDTSTGIAHSGVINDLRDYETYGKEADLLLVRKCYYAPMMVIAYR